MAIRKPGSANISSSCGSPAPETIRLGAGAHLPVRNPNALGRCMRGTLVANSHLLFDGETMTDAGPPILKNWVRQGPNKTAHPE